jgi:hypothetical protein
LTNVAIFLSDNSRFKMMKKRAVSTQGDLGGWRRWWWRSGWFLVITRERDAAPAGRRGSVLYGVGAVAGGGDEAERRDERRSADHW